MASQAGAVEGLQTVAMPLHLQKLQHLLNLTPLLSHIEKLFVENGSDWSRRTSPKLSSEEQKCLEQAAASDARVYNFSVITEERKWVQDLLLSDSEGSESELSESEQVQLAMELHYRKRKKWRRRLRREPKLWKYRYFSAGLLMSHDHYPEHVKSVEELISSGEAQRKVAREIAEDRKREEEHRRQVQKEKERYRVKLWAFISKKEIPKMAKQFATARHNVITNSKRVAQLCQREVKRSAQKSQRASKEVSLQPRARRLMREALMYWRRYEKTEKEQRRKAEREAVEQRKIDDEMREAKRQQRKLNFLITQTELYAHFMAKKLTGTPDMSGEILQQLDDAPLLREVQPGVVVELENPGEYDSEAMKAQALANVEAALQKQEETQHSFDKRRVGGSTPPAGSTDLQESFDKAFSLATPVLYSEREVPQPLLFKGTLKAYQLKGMNWLANLYDQGINGILADEMGLGKTVQSIALLAHLAERQGIWGPFLVVAPASTLHNWQQECSKFLPRLKVLPYWGSPHERKIIRKYWNPKLLFKESAPFHILITSYQLVVQDVKYFHRVKWQYMILDEAQAIKSSSSIRWKVLLSFSCRNRLLLTGTPIQNTMQELWALLHFIMPTMFDSHEEFNEWFSKDIESHAEKKSALDENQLSRLHMILKPFMLRRIKRDVEHEMADKIEVHLSCELSMRQKRLYHGLRQRISIEDLLQSSHAHSSLSSHSSKETSHLLNLVMQFRKVCNHPDLFERRDVVSPLSLAVPSPVLPHLIYHQLYCPRTDWHRLLTVALGVHTAHHVHQASLTDTHSLDHGCWSFLRLTGISPQEVSTVMLGTFSDRLQVLMALMNRAHLLYRQRFWQSGMSASRYQSTQLVLWPDQRVSFAAVHYSPALENMVFTRPSSSLYTHTIHRLFPLKTTSQASAELTEISSMISGSERDKSSRSTPADSRLTSACSSPRGLRDGGKEQPGGQEGTIPNGLNQNLLPPSVSSPSSSPSSPASLSALCQDHHSTSLSPAKVSSSKHENLPPSHVNSNSIKSKINGEMRIGSCDFPSNDMSQEQQTVQGATSNGVIFPCRELQGVPTDMPKFLLAFVPTVEVPLNPLYCSDRVAEYRRQEWLRGGPKTFKQLLLHGPRDEEREDQQSLGLLPSLSGGLDAARSPNGWSHIVIPDKENMIYDSGKMAVLDKLLAQLKREGHRVLLYSQMTRMIDLLEEFMSYRRYRFIRLDGSSRISDRRDMVDDFQSKSDIFVFLLSTRAGGLGINLTAADTVIFYDSDWNPTVDQQAMDRAHRLGQTKQVTVYRLVVKGSIEERILQRAREKSEIQKMVISGGDFKPDALKPKEMVSLLLDDEEMETRFLAKQAEKMQEQELGKRVKGKKRKSIPNGRENEPLTKKPNISTSPSPLIFSSRPASVMSAASSDLVVNGDLVVDIADGTAEDPSQPSGTLFSAHQEKHRGRTSAPLGGRGKFQKRKGGGGGSSMSAAASAGAMAGALAASNATFATLGYSLPSYQATPSPSNSLSAYPASSQGNSTHSSPRASPIPISTALSQTPPGGRLSVPRTLLAQSRNS